MRFYDLIFLVGFYVRTRLQTTACSHHICEAILYYNDFARQFYVPALEDWELTLDCFPAFVDHQHEQISQNLGESRSPENTQ